MSELFLKDLHLSFIRKLDSDERKGHLDYWMLDHLRISGIYWALTSCCLLGYGPLNPQFDTEYSPLSRAEILKFLQSCRHSSGGFGGNAGLDPHILFTYSAVQILVILDQVTPENIDMDATVSYISNLQRPDGSFCGDEFGEVDTRFLYCGVAALSLLGRLDAINKDTAADYLAACRNFDGGFGASPGCESHAVFCCVAASQILGRMDLVDRGPLIEWLAFRQLPCGGLNGRPEKLEDVCYSWWVLSALHILSPTLHQIDRTALRQFILSCQDPLDGGISDRPGDVADIFHTLFGIAGLALIGEEGLEPVDPAYCMPSSSLNNLLKK